MLSLMKKFTIEPYACS